MKMHVYKIALMSVLLIQLTSIIGMQQIPKDVEVLELKKGQQWTGIQSVNIFQKKFPEFFNTNYPFTIDDIEYKSVDDYVNKQAKKITKTWDPAELAQYTTIFSKQTTQKQQTFQDVLWDATKLVVYAQALRAQVAQNPDLQDILTDTEKNNIIIVMPKTEKYYGVTQAQGENFIGQILMKIRDDILNKKLKPSKLPIPTSLKKAFEAEKIKGNSPKNKNGEPTSFPWQYYVPGLQADPDTTAQSWADVPANNATTFYDITKRYSQFSNLFLAPITIDGTIWPSSEQYYQAMKFSDYPTIQEKIRNFKTGGEAFDFVNGKRGAKTKQEKQQAATQKAFMKKLVRSDWPTKGTEYMLKAVWTKFNQHEDLKGILERTDPRVIIENALGKDEWYGNGLSLDKKRNDGQNWLGRILMLVRAELTGKPLPQPITTATQPQTGTPSTTSPASTNPQSLPQHPSSGTSVPTSPPVSIPEQEWSWWVPSWFITIWKWWHNES